MWTLYLFRVSQTTWPALYVALKLANVKTLFKLKAQKIKLDYFQPLKTHIKRVLGSRSSFWELSKEKGSYVMGT